MKGDAIELKTNYAENAEYTDYNENPLYLPRFFSIQVFS